MRLNYFYEKANERLTDYSKFIYCMRNVILIFPLQNVFKPTSLISFWSQQHVSLTSGLSVNIAHASVIMILENCISDFMLL